MQDRCAVTVKKGSGGSRVQIVQNAVDRKHDHGAQYDEVWCVFDTESLDSSDARKDYEDALSLARQHNIRTAISNPSFEVWLLAHFRRSKKSFRNGDAVIVELNKEWDQFFRAEYHKSDDRVYSKIAHLTETAIANARDVRDKDHAGRRDIADCNSATEVHLLVERLLRGDDQQAG